MMEQLKRVNAARAQLLSDVSDVYLKALAFQRTLFNGLADELTQSGKYVAPVAVGTRVKCPNLKRYGTVTGVKMAIVPDVDPYAYDQFDELEAGLKIVWHYTVTPDPTPKTKRPGVPYVTSDALLVVDENMHETYTLNVPVYLGEEC